MASTADAGGHFPDRAYLSLTGGTLTGRLLLPDGLVGAPAWAFASDPNTGPYSIGADNFGISVGGVKALDIGTVLTTPLSLRSSLNGAAAIYASGGASSTIRCDGTGAAAFNAPSGGGTFGLGVITGGASTGTISAIGTAQTVGHSLINATDAAAGAQQYSPVLELEGQGWKTDATAATMETKWGLQVRPVQGAAAPTSILDFLSSINGAAYGASLASLDSAGIFSASRVASSSTNILAVYALNGGLYAGLANAGAINSANGGVTAKSTYGFDSNDAAVLPIGNSTATGVRVGKSGGNVGFYGTTPIAQGASVADATDAATAITQLNALISRIEALGLIATV